MSGACAKFSDHLSFSLLKPLGNPEAVTGHYGGLIKFNSHISWQMEKEAGNYLLWYLPFKRGLLYLGAYCVVFVYTSKFDRYWHSPTPVSGHRISSNRDTALQPQSCIECMSHAHSRMGPAVHTTQQRLSIDDCFATVVCVNYSYFVQQRRHHQMDTLCLVHVVCTTNGSCRAFFNQPPQLRTKDSTENKTYVGEITRRSGTGRQGRKTKYSRFGGLVVGRTTSTVNYYLHLPPSHSCDLRMK